MSAGAGGDEGMAKPVHRIRGHTGSILCCTTSRNSPDEVITSSEDGSVRVFDLRNYSCSMKHQFFGGESVVSVSVNPGNATQLYVAAGTVVYSVDLRLGSSGRELQRYDFNLDEINQVVGNQKGSYVAAADDSGEIKVGIISISGTKCAYVLSDLLREQMAYDLYNVIDVHNCRLYRTLRGVHTNICSTVQFHPQRPWEVISGGLDSKIIKWDFSKGKDLRSVDLVAGNTNVGQLCNPPFVHALAVPEGNGSGDSGRLVAVARGDGAVEVYDIGFDDKSFAVKGLKNKKGNYQSESNQGEIGGPALRVNGLMSHLNPEHGGHSAAVSSVAFAAFGEKEQILVSGGNDKFIKVWKWRSSPLASPSNDGSALVLNIRHGKKINWVSTVDRNNGNLLVADTSKVLSVYHIL